jgi:hypothetical protein
MFSWKDAYIPEKAPPNSIFMGATGELTRAVVGITFQKHIQNLDLHFKSLEKRNAKQA